MEPILNQLRELGVQLHLDDFGVGYSSLRYLQRFPFQAIKIDRSFVNGMKDGGNTEIIRAIVALAGALKMDVAAEGVETAQQLKDLKGLSCEFGQGYYFDKPLSLEDASDILRLHEMEESATNRSSTRLIKSRPPIEIQRRSKSSAAALQSRCRRCAITSSWRGSTISIAISDMLTPRVHGRGLRGPIGPVGRVLWLRSAPTARGCRNLSSSLISTNTVTASFLDPKPSWRANANMRAV